MEPFFPTIWNVFHDGSIDQVNGVVPGTIAIHVSIEYLRERFADSGEQLIVTLPGCSKCSYKSYNDRVATTDLATISDIVPGILNAEMDEDLCRIFCDDGTLELIASDGTIHLDSGREVPLEELLEVATKYWEEWESKPRE